MKQKLRNVTKVILYCAIIVFVLFEAYNWGYNYGDRAVKQEKANFSEKTKTSIREKKAQDQFRK